MSNIKLLQGDCLELMRDIPDGSVDAIIADPPYGTTACKWDTVIPFEPMWEQLKRIAKPRAAIVLFSSQPFTSALVMSNVEMFKYEWVWQKEQGVGFQIAKYRPMIEHENAVVFSKESANYYPQMESTRKPIVCVRKSNNGDSETSPIKYSDNRTSVYTERYPTSIKKFTRDKGDHPTQKPVAFLEYLIRTYTNEGDTVLDFTMGSGTTMVACVNTQRHGIGIEILPEYFEIAEQRIHEAQMQPTLLEGLCLTSPS